MTYKSMLDNFLSSQRPQFSLSQQVWNPPTDIYETAEATVIKIEAAGLDESQLQITADRNLLIVRGQREHGHTCERKINYQLMEIHYGQFERIFAFSYNLDEQSIQARYEKGFVIVEVRRQSPSVTSVPVRVVREPGEER